MKTIIAGCRHIESPKVVFSALIASGFRPVTEVVSGCSKGVDVSGEIWAKTFGIPIKHFPADWKTHGKAAGPMRNQQMADYADALIAVWDGKSTGTKDMIRRAKAKGLKVYVHHVD